MRVESIELENIRSHVKTKMQFDRGFNCLVGGVGCGKSSVLYSIDFALFGEPLARSYEYLLRESADTCKVTLQFAHARKTYTLMRGLRKRGRGIGQDWEQLKLYEEDKLLASMKSEAVAEQLKAITGLDKEIFRDIVWVRQELLKELLNMTPRERQKRLDELFGLSDYEAAWSNLAGFQKEYEGEKRAYERDYDIIGIEKLQTEYNKSVQEFASIEGELQNLKDMFNQAETRLKEAESLLKNLEELRRQTEALKRNEAQLQTNIANMEDTCARLAEAIEGKESSFSALIERLDSMETEEKSQREKLQRAGLKPAKTTEELRKYLLTLEEQARSIGAEQEVVKKEMHSSRRRTSSLTAENKCPLCLQTITDHYKKALLDQINKENAEREKRLAELQKDLDGLEGLQNIISQVTLTIQTLAPRIEEVRRQTTEARQSMEKMSTEFEQKQKQERMLREQLDAVRNEIAKFDLTQLESTRKLRDKAFMDYSDVKHKLDSTETRKRDLSSKIEELKQRLDNAEQKLNRMKRIEGLLEIVGGIRGAYRSIQPRLRTEFVTYLRRVIQQVLDELVGVAGPALIVSIDEAYSPIVKSEEGFERDITNISGGERTLLAFAYRLGLGQLVVQSRTGHGLYMLILDEPTESLGREDGSIDRLAEAISRLKAIEQIIAVTHSEAFAEKAEHVIRVEKEAGISRIIAEK